MTRTHEPVCLLLAASLSLACVVLPLRAAGQERPAATEEASDEFQTLIRSGLVEFDGRRYAEALALFTRAHELRPSARTERALGKTTFELGRYVDAVRWLEASLVNETSPLTSEMRSEVQELLVRARSFIGVFRVSSPTAGASARLGTVPLQGDLATGIELTLALGVHELEIEAPAHEPERRRLSVAGGERDELTFELRPIAVASQASSVDTTARDLGWASMVGRGVLTLAGIVSLAIWADAVGTLNANIRGGACFAEAGSENVIGRAAGEAPQAQCLALQSRYRLALPFAWIGLAAGGALLATGLALALFAPTTSEGERAGAVRCGPFAELGATCAVAF